MKIAYVSFECPPDTAYGGIGTYIEQISVEMARRGHHVEVFSSSPLRDESVEQNGVRIHRIRHEDRDTFKDAVAELIVRRHAEVDFHVVEGPEFGADASAAVSKIGSIPFVVKLHTPNYLVWRSSAPDVSLHQRLRAKLRAWRRGLIEQHSLEHPLNQGERAGTLLADLIVSPSAALADIVARDWLIDRHSIRVVPNVFVSRSLAKRPPESDCSGLVVYAGRLESRKGVLDLARAVPDVLKRVPKAKFMFVGRSLPSPEHGKLMEQYLREMLAGFTDSVEFTGGVSQARVIELMRQSQICVVPSRWENFPNTCLEAMAVGCAVVGTSNSGIAEQLDHGKAGVLVPPRSPKALAAALTDLLASPEECGRLGRTAQNRLQREYGADTVCPAVEEAYALAINKRLAAGPRVLCP